MKTLRKGGNHRVLDVRMMLTLLALVAVMSPIMLFLMDSMLPPSLPYSVMQHRRKDFSLSSLSSIYIHWEHHLLLPDPMKHKFWISKGYPSVNNEGYHIYRRILVSKGWVEAKTPSEDGIIFKFISKSVNQVFWDMFHPSDELVNHSPHEELRFGDKVGFLRLLKHHQKNHSCDYTTIHPPSFLLDTFSECMEFMNSVDLTDKTQSWFLKSSRGSGGKGIQVFDTPKLLEALTIPESSLREVTAKKLFCMENTDDGDFDDTQLNKRFIQKSVRPMLIKDRKFDIRLFLIIMSFDPLIVFFRHGYLRRSMTPFNAKGSDLSIHLTNTMAQVETKEYSISEHYWSMDQLESHLRSKRMSEKEYRKSFDLQLKRLVFHTFMTIKDSLSRQEGQFVVLGLDVIYDVQLNPQLLEVNVNPYFDYDTKRYGAEHVEFFITLCTEVLESVYTLFQRRKSKSQLNPSSLGLDDQWTLLYDESGKSIYRFDKDECFHSE